MLLFLDNCTANPKNISASNLKVILLPANTTSVLQVETYGCGYHQCFKGCNCVKMARYLIKWVSDNQI